MLYIVYETDGEAPGRIVQANRVYASESELTQHETVLNQLGKPWLKEPVTGPAIPSHEHFHVVNGVRTERPVMPIQAEKLTAVSDEYVLLTGLVPSSTVTLFAGTTQFDQQITDDDTTEMEFHPPAPGKYTIRIEKWPYKTFQMNVGSNG